MRTKTNIQMDRRGILQRLGGIGALVTAPCTVEPTTAEQNPEEGLGTGNFQFVTTDVSTPSLDDAPIMINCSHYSHFIKSSAGAYLPTIEIDDDGHSHLISSLRGVDQFSNQFRIDYSMIPHCGTATGTYRAAAGDIQLNPVFTVTEKGIQIDIAGEQTRIPPRKSFDTKVQTDIEYETWEGNLRSETIDAKISVTNHGNQDLFWHSDKVLIPKGTAAGSQIKPMLGSNSAVVVEAQSEASPTYVISDIPSVSAYGITRKQQDDRQSDTSEDATESNEKEYNGI